MTIRLASGRLVAAIAGLALVAACPAQAAFPGENGKIAFSSTRGSPRTQDIYAMNADGSGQTNLTASAASGVVVEPAWSPDGAKIAFRNGTATLVMNADGSGQTSLTNNGFEPAWSPDGRKIAFATNRDGNFEIYVMNANGSAQSNLTKNPAADTAPTWSPDGTKIALTRLAPSGNQEIFSMKADGSDQVNLTNTPVTDNDPDWSPDGTKIAFESFPPGQANADVFVMDQDGSNRKNVTVSPTHDLLPAWSPDGQKIAFVSLRNQSDLDIFVMNANGSGTRNLSNNPATDQDPSWQPIPACSGAEGGDTDGDGLCNSWETSGIDSDDDGTIDLKLYDANGDGTISQDEQADPDHKDLYVEIDTMNGEPLDLGALRDVVHAFFVAPVPNPDGTSGINLHVELDDTVPQTPIIAFPPCTRAARAGESDFDQLKARFFGSAGQRASDPAVLDAKRLAFRYVIWAHGLATDDGTSGCSELPGNDLVVTLGTWAGTRDEQAGTFMHEFGHALGLRHGGVDNNNCKPNYLSVMNYSFQVNIPPITNRPLDYSRAALPTLFESLLSEPAGLGGPPGRQSVFGPNRVPIPASGPVDWNQDSDTNDSAVLANVNSNPSFGCSGAGTTLVGADDWDRLSYDFKHSPDFADGVHSTAGDVDEMTHEQAVANSPDSDGDGVPDFEDDCVCATPPACADAKPPEAKLRSARARHGKLRLSGTADDSTQCAGEQGAVARVEAAIGRHAGKRCRYLDQHGKPGPKRSCDKPAFLTARGTVNWKLKIKHPPAGRYRVEVRAADAAGNLSAVAKGRLRVKG